MKLVLHIVAAPLFFIRALHISKRTSMDNLRLVSYSKGTVKSELNG